MSLWVAKDLSPLSFYTLFPGLILGKSIDMPNNEPTNKTLSLTKQLLIIALAALAAAVITQVFDYVLDMTYEVDHLARHFIETFLIILIAETTAYFVLKKQKALYDRANTEIAKRKKTEISLKETGERFKILFEYAPDAYLISNLDGKIIDANAAAEQILGYPKEEIINFNYTQLFPDYQQKTATASLLASERGLPTGPHEFILQKKDGNADVEIRTFPVKIRNQALMLVAGREIGKRKKIMDALKQTERKYRLMVESFPNVLRIYDKQGKITYVSPNIQKFYGFLQQEIYNSDIEQIWVSRIHPEDKERVKFAFRQLFFGQSYNLEYRIQKKDGSWIWVHDIGELVKENTEYHTYAVSTNITKRKEMEQEIKHLAYYDTITSLPNRQQLKSRFEQSLAFAKRSNNILAVLYLDLDKFKSVNDWLGHDAGDILLKEVGNRLAKAVRDTDTVARVGGDEFVIILTMIQRKNDAALLAQNFLDSIAKPFAIENQQINVTASIGISIFPDDGDNLQSLTTKADDAMRLIKSKKPNDYKFFKYG